MTGALDTSACSGYYARIAEWHTYTPDGRALAVRPDGSGGWEASCGGSELVGDASLRQAIAEALGNDEPVAIRTSSSKLSEWIDNQASRIEEDWRAANQVS